MPLGGWFEAKLYVDASSSPLGGASEATHRVYTLLCRLAPRPLTPRRSIGRGSLPCHLCPWTDSGGGRLPSSNRLLPARG